MARGHQKFQAQQKNAKRQADIKKSKGHDQKAAAKAALAYTCTVCQVCASNFKQDGTLISFYHWGEPRLFSTTDIHSTVQNKNKFSQSIYEGKGSV